MATNQFVRSYDDLSNDKGYQYRFRCDKCGAAVTTEFKTSALGVAQSVLNVAGGLLGSWGYRAGSAAYEMQRATGGRSRESALAEAVEEVRPQFRQCTGCAKWVCASACWNESANQCRDCAPKAATQSAQAACGDCGAAVGSSKFCPECGKPVAKAGPQFCPGCGKPAGGSKFCGECGHKIA